MLGTSKLFGIIDCNNFYASCERLFNGHLEGKPVVVFSNNDGAIIARSEEAKALGIKMTNTVFMIRDFLIENNVQMFSSNYTLYGDMSKRVKSIIRSCFENVEDYSIDESFVDCSGLELLDINKYIKASRDRISKDSGIPVSIGVAPTKTLAKLANRIAKKKYREIGVYVIDSEEKRIEALKSIDVNDVWMVGPAITKKLFPKGIKTAYDLSLVEPEVAKRNFSVVLERTVWELRGISCIPLELTPEPKQHIASQKAFGIKQTEFQILAEALSTYTARVAEKLRKDKSVAGGMEVWVATDKFSSTDKKYNRTIRTRFPVPTDFTPDLIKQAIAGLKEIYCEGILYKRVGVMLTDLRKKSDVTLNLFEQIDREKQDKLTLEMDRINRLNGRDAVKSGQQQGFSDEWKMKQEHLSRKYTTRLSDIITVK